MKKISLEELKKILELHKKWIENKEDGFRADLSYADLRYANLSYANLSYADLRYANLSYANLSDANLSDANLSDANLSDANLRYAKYNENTSFFALQCPEEGSFIGFKKCKDNRIVKLLILEDAKRSSATSKKCRCDKAKVLSITNLDGTEKFDEAVSQYDDNFIYKAGEIVESNFDENRWNECTKGIHFFITRDEAINYIL